MKARVGHVPAAVEVELAQSRAALQHAPHDGVVHLRVCMVVMRADGIEALLRFDSRNPDQGAIVRCNNVNPLQPCSPLRFMLGLQDVAARLV